MNEHTATSANYFIIFLCAVYAVYQLWQATTWGAGLSPDSVSYLSAARSINTTTWLSETSSHWPPFYSIAIAFAGLFSDDILFSIRCLQAVTLFLNVSMFGFIILRCTGSILPIFAGTALLATSPAFLEIHAMAWSEGLFCLFTITGFFFLAAYLNQNSNSSFFLISALLIGLTCIIRYSGVAVLFSALISLTFLSRLKPLTRLFHTFLFGLVGSLFLILWLSYNIVRGTSSTNREFVFHPIPVTKLNQAAEVVSGWFHLPDNSEPGLILVIICLLALLILGKRREYKRSEHLQLMEISFIFVLTYLAFLAFSLSYIDAHIPLDTRILIPAFQVLFLGIILLLCRLKEHDYLRWLSTIGLSLLIVSSIINLPSQRAFVYKASSEGIGLASRVWQTSETVAWLRAQPENLLIYTNAPEPIILYTDHRAIMLPLHTDPVTWKINKRYYSNLFNMAERLKEQKGVIVFFYAASSRWYLPSLKDLKTGLWYTELQKTSDATILKYSDSVFNSP